jgi:AcrR family transcriptional regulator
MPKDTFYNLPEEKRDRIIDIALDEFAMYDYRTASLSRVVENAGIAKGSMYQYFDNKKDLYLYLIDFVSNKKLEYISRHLDVASHTDFFKLYEDMIFVAAKFGIDYPKYERVGYNAFKESYNEEIGQMSTKLLNASRDYIRSFIVKGQSDGQIRTDIEADLAAFIISRVSIDIGDYLMEKYNFTREQMIKENDRLPITDEQLGHELKELIKLLKTGLLCKHQ